MSSPEQTYQTQLDLVAAVNALTVAIESVFPAGIGTSATAVAGAATLPANPVGFITTTLPGTTTVVKIPYFA